MSRLGFFGKGDDTLSDINVSCFPLHPQMKTIRWIAFAALTGFSCIISPGQALILTGKVTNVSGIYDGIFSNGENVILSLDDSTPPVDLYHGAFAEAHYFSPFSLTVNGESVVLGLDPLYAGIVIHNQYPDLSRGDGMLIGIGWNGAKNPGEFLQYMLSQNDILSSTTHFPSGIPIDQFFRTDGYYQNESSPLWGGAGRIEWTVTAYSGSFDGILTPPPPPPPFTPVPETSTYGTAAAIALLGLIIFRRKNGSWLKLSHECK